MDILPAAAIEQSKDPLLLTDVQGRIAAWSHGAQELFQYTKEDVLGRSPMDFIAPLLRARQQALELGGVHNAQATVACKNKQRIPVELTLTLLKDSQGPPLGMLYILRDTTEHKKLEHMTSEMVAIAGHEMRTPLTCIRGFAQVLLEYGDEMPRDQRKQHLEVILKDAKRLSQMLADLLDVSRIESGQAQLKRQPVDLKALAERVTASFQGHPAKRPFELQFEEKLPQAQVDASQMHRVLVNLCGNALKYSPPEGVIRISARRTGELIEMGVADQGPGIHPEHQKLLFQKFFRLGDPITMNTQGTGLGLSIAKSIVESHGGRIWIESDPGKGAKFLFNFPIKNHAAD